MPDSPVSCGRKPYLERKSCGFKNIRIHVGGASDVPSMSLLFELAGGVIMQNDS